jgi:translocation and assembly module TamB
MGEEEAPTAGEAPPPSAISGVVTADLQGREARNLTGSIGLSLAPSRFQGATIDSAAFQVDFREGEAGVRLDVLAGPNRLRGTGGANLSSTPVPFQGALSLELPDAASFHESIEVATALFASARVEGQGLSADSIRLTSTLTVDSARYGNLTVDRGGLEGTLSGEALELDTAFVQMSAGSFGASGTLPRRGAGGRVAFEGQITRAESLAQLVGADVLLAGESTAHGAVEGSLEAFAVNGEVHISALLWNRVRVQDLTLLAEGQFREGRAVPNGRATLSAERIELPAAPVRRLDVEVVANDHGEIGVDASADIDDLRDASLYARIEPGGGGRSLHIERFDFRADEDRWSLAYPTRMTFADGFAVDSLLVSAGDQQLRARGRIPRADAVDFRASLEGFNLETVADLLGRPDMSGFLSASVDVHGMGMAPRVHLRIASSLAPPAASPGELQADLSLGGDTLRVQASVVTEDGRTLDIGGSVPMAFSMGNDSSGVLHDGPLDMQVRADSLTMAWFDPFLPGTNLRRLKGVLDGSVRVGGTPAEPSLSGEMWVRDGSLRLPALGLHLTSLGSRIAFAGNEIRADSLRIVSGDGPLSGSLALVFSGSEPPAVSGTLQARDFELAGRADLRASVSGSVDLGGTSSSPSVSGRLEVERADIYLGDRMATPHAAPVTLTEEDYRELATVFGYRPPTETGSTFALWDSTTLDLRVRLNRDLWVRQSSNPEMAVQFTGDVDVTKAAGDSLQLLGTVEGVPGRSYVKQFGRRFDLSQGTVTLRGPLSATMVDLTAVYEVPSRGNPDAPEATISLQLQGTPSDLGLELTSTPVMGGSDLVSYLVVGRPAGELLDGGGTGGETDLARTGGALALARASSAVEAYAREQVGLDVVEITTDGLEGLTLLAGRYVSPELYLGVRQPLSLEGPTEQRTEGNPNPELEVELEAVRWLLLNLRAGGRSGLELFVRSRISYD